MAIKRSEAGKNTSWKDWFIYIVLVMLIAMFTILNKNFFSFSNLGNITRQAAMVSIIGFGMTFLITSANIDLSVGSVAALTGVMAAFTLKWGFGIIGASLVGIFIGVLIGLINGKDTLFSGYIGHAQYCERYRPHNNRDKSRSNLQQGIQGILGSRRAVPRPDCFDLGCRNPGNIYNYL
jgi:hypothetical protein